MKSRQVMTITHNGMWRVVEYTTQKNPYRIYRDYFEDGRRHRKQVAAYGDLASCVWWFLQNGIV